MKKILLMTIITCFANLAEAQIKNAGFEDWTNLSTHVYEAEMLDSHNVLNPLHGDIVEWNYSFNVGISQTTDASEGNYAAILHNWYNYAQTTLTYRDTVSFYPGQLTGMYKYISDPFTSGTVNVIVKSTIGDTIINSDWYLGPQINWESFTQDLNPLMSTTDPADSIIITLKNSEYACQGNMMTCNLLYVDDFTLVQGTASLKDQSLEEFQIFPNPANNIVTLQLRDMAEFENLEVAFIDMMGNVVHSQSLEGVQNVISIQHLDSGTYVVRMTGEEGRTTHRSLIIQ